MLKIFGLMQQNEFLCLQLIYCAALINKDGQLSGVLHCSIDVTRHFPIVKHSAYCNYITLSSNSLPMLLYPDMDPNLAW